MFKWLEKNLPKIVMAPAVGLIGWFVYGFVLWTLYISFTNSKILPKYELWGFGQYEKLWASRKWLISVDNLLIFTALFLVFCIVIGIILAIFLDQKIRSEGLLRTIYLYPMALSFIVTGTAWKWILNPTLGIQKYYQNTSFGDLDNTKSFGPLGNGLFQWIIYLFSQLYFWFFVLLLELF